MKKTTQKCSIVNVSSCVNARSSPDSSSSSNIVKTVNLGTTVEYTGETDNNFMKVKVDGKELWIHSSKLSNPTPVINSKEVEEEKEASNKEYIENIQSAGEETDNEYSKKEKELADLAESVEKYTISDKDYKKWILRCRNAFGSPFNFLEATDPIYLTGETNPYDGIGRVMLKTLYSSPTMFSILPGKVTYLPNANKEEKNDFKALLSGVVTESFEGGTGALSGQLYSLTPAYDDYINRFNVLARASAIMLGLGDIKMPGTNIPLKEYDYSYYSTENRQTESKGAVNSLFDSVKKSFSGSIDDSLYIHFFLMNEGSSVSSNFTTGKTESVLKEKLDSFNIDRTVANINFLFGGVAENSNLINTISSDLENLTSKVSSNGGILGDLASIVKGYAAGGHLVIPDMIDSVDYSNSVSCHMKFVAPYGDKLTIFLTTLLPTLAIFNFIVPKQISENMYTYPYIIKAYQQGWYNTDLAIMENLRIERGGSDDTAWTVDGLSTEVDVTFDITPLYSSMMSASSKNPYLFMTNDSMLQYLGNLCGLDLKTDNFKLKQDLFNQLVKSSITDIPASVGRNAFEGIRNKIHDIFSW